MKKIILTACVFSLLSFSSKAIIIVAQCNGGDCGYREVLETHEGGFDALSCQDPGYNDCFFQQKLTESDLTFTDANDLMETVNDRIRVSINAEMQEGSFTISGHTVNWSYNISRDLINYTIN